MRLSLDPIRRLFLPPADRRLAAALAAPASPPPTGPRTLEPAAPGMPPRVALERADLGMAARMRLWRDEQRQGIRTPWLPVGLHWRFEDMEMVWESAEIGTMLPLARMVEAMRSEAIISGLMGARSSFITKPVTWSGDPWLADWLRGKPALYVNGQMAEREQPSRFLLMAPDAALFDLLWTGTLAGAAAAELVDDPVLGLPVAQTRDLHRVRYDWGTRQWKYLGETEEYVIEPGNGRWIFFMPYATHRPWRSGSWLPLALAFVVMMTATYDAGRFQATNADPLKHVSVDQNVPPEEVDKLLEFVQLWWERNPRIVLPYGAKAGIVESNGQGYQIYEKQRTWAKQQINFTLRGSTATSGDQEGIFNDPEEAYEVAEQLVQQSANALAKCLNEQLVAPTLRRFGLIQRRAEAPTLAWDTRSPTRKVKEAAAVGQVCDVVTKLDALGKPRGRMVDIDDFFQRAGLTVKWLEISSEAAQIEPGSDPEGGDEPPDPDGGGESAALPDAPSPPQLPPARPVDSVVDQTRPDGTLASRAREVRRRRLATLAAAETDDEDIDAARARLKAALAELDALGPEDEEQHEAAAKFDEGKHPRAADGKFGEGGGSTEKPKPKPKGTKDSLGTGRDAKQARKDSKSAEEASAKAKTPEEHKAAAKANADAAARHRAAAKASRKKEYREAHLRVAEAHEALARAHEEKAAPSSPQVQRAPTNGYRGALEGAGIRVGGASRGKTDEIAAHVFGRDSAPTVESLQSVWGSETIGIKIREVYADDDRGEGHKLISYEGHITDKAGNKIGDFQRSFIRHDNGELEVHHDLFKIDVPKKHGQGAGEAMLRQSIRAYEPMGVNKITVDAAWVGKYTWASFGYNWGEQKAPLMEGRLSSFLHRNGVSAADAARISKEIAGESWKVASLDIPGMKIKVPPIKVGGKIIREASEESAGKAFLLSGDWTWSGELRLDDQNHPTYKRAKERLKL